MSRTALQQPARTRPRAGTGSTDSSVVGKRPRSALRIVHEAVATKQVTDLRVARDVTEASLLAFSPDDDAACLVPMPPGIPQPIRDALTTAFGARFEFHDELDRWLHAPLEALAGATPYERIVVGDGLGVLRALEREGAEEMTGPEQVESPTPDHTRSLRVVDGRARRNRIAHR